MKNFNLNDIEQIMTFYLIFNFIILVCLIYIIISLIFRVFFRNKEQEKIGKNKKRKKKDIIDLFWTEDNTGKIKTIFKRTFLIVFTIFTLFYIFNSISFITDNIDIVKKVLKIE